MSVSYIVQARMGSSRLPGKVMADVGGRPLLGVMLDRLTALEGGPLVVATSCTPLDDAIAAYCSTRAVPVVRGSELDVLSRFVDAVDLFPCDVVVRLTADCPLADPHLIDEAVALHTASNADYTSNTLVRTYPDGLDVEVVDVECLRRAEREAVAPVEREHVTPFLYRHPEHFVLAGLSTDLLAGDERWTVDTTDDLDFIRSIVARTPQWASLAWHDILTLVGRQFSPPTDRVLLRPARLSDAEALFTWRNDQQTVRFSGSRRSVSRSEHARWLQRSLATPATRVWMAEVGGVTVGQVRVDVVDARGELDITVAPLFRGRGYGAEIVSVLLCRLRSDLQITRLTATVHRENPASLRLFETNGFKEFNRTGEFAVLAFER